MQESTKPFAYAMLPKSRSTSWQSSSHTDTNKPDQQYLPVKRAWTTPIEPASFQHHTQSEDTGKTNTSDQVDAQYLSPMERWKKEDIRQSQWNNVASCTALCDSKDHVSSQRMEGQADNWSMTGNAQSEKWKV